MHLRKTSGLLVLALALACADSRTPADGTTGEASTGEASTGGAPAWPMLPPRPATQVCRFDGQAPGLLPPLQLAPIDVGESLAEVVDVAPAGPERMFVAEAGGRIFVGSVDGGALTQVVDLGARGRVVALATRSDFSTTGRLYVRYEAAVGSPRAVIAHLTVDQATWTADLASERIVLEIDGAVGPRSGGALVFDESDMLVIGVGDLGGGLASAAQDPTTRVGKLLRVEPLEGSGRAIPADNPFIGMGGDADEVWAVGLRDPWRCSAGAGALWCVDVGEVEHEVDRVTRGLDLGWPRIEGSVCLLPGGDCSHLEVKAPSATYRSDDGDCGVSGALFGVAGGLEATFVYADRCSGRVRGVDTTDPDLVVQEELLAREPAGVVGLARDGRGDAIAITGDARLARLVAAPPPGAFPTRLSVSGCFADLATLAPVPGVVPYGVNAELWSDGAFKSRFVALPAGATIAVADDGALELPIGTVLLKTFAFEFTAGDPATRRPVETRVMVRHEYGWQFHSYRWNAGGTDAELLAGGESASLTIAEHDATVEFDYSWPSRGTCKVCHGFGESRALGPRIEQLNGDFDYGDASANQLLVLAELGMFTAALPGEPGALPRIPGAAEPDAPLEARARGYLHTNCSHCHRPGGWTPPALTMDLRWSTPLADTRTCGVATQYVNPWVEGELRIAPGDPDTSAIWQRLHRRGPGQMPPLGTTRVDPHADAVRDWIAQLGGCP